MLGEHTHSNTSVCAAYKDLPSSGKVLKRYAEMLTKTELGP